MNGYVETKEMETAVEDAILKRPGLEYLYDFGPGFLKGAIRDYDNSWFIFKDNKIYKNPTRTWVPGGGSGEIDALDVVWADCNAEHLWKSGDTLYLAYINSGGHWAIRSYNTLTDSKSEVGQCVGVTAFDYINTYDHGRVASEVDSSGIVWAVTWSIDLTALVTSQSSDGGIAWSHVVAEGLEAQIVSALVARYGAVDAAAMNVYLPGVRFVPGYSGANVWVAVPILAPSGVLFYFYLQTGDGGVTWTNISYDSPHVVSANKVVDSADFAIDHNGSLLHTLPLDNLPARIAIFGEDQIALKDLGDTDYNYLFVRSPVVRDGGSGRQDVYFIPPCICKDMYNPSSPAPYVPSLTLSGTYIGHQLNSAGDWFIIRNNDLVKARWAVVEGHWETGAEQTIDIGGVPSQLSLVAVK